MDFDYNEKTLEHKEKLEAFMQEHVYPAEAEHHAFIEDPLSYTHLTLPTIYSV